jgi:DNA-binding response OmpR family regulator
MSLVLIVEDNEKNLKLVRDVLQAKGYATLEAGSAEEGLALARERAPGLILMDIHLPGMSGIEVLKALRADAPHIPDCGDRVVMQQDRNLITRRASRLHRKPINLKIHRHRAFHPRAQAGMSDQGARRRRHPAEREAAGRPASVKGYAVATAADGEEGLAKVATEAPDLVLLDVMMPGLSGYDVCRRLRADQRTALLPVVLVTSLDPQQERVKGIEAGADDFLAKPINQLELFARVRSLLRIKALQDEVGKQAAALREWNAKLEDRVNEQVGELERLGRLKRFYRSPSPTPSSQRESSILAPHRREICRLRRPAWFHFVHGRRRAGGSRGRPARVSHRHGEGNHGIRRDARPVRRRRHPDLLQRSFPHGRARKKRGADGVGDARGPATGARA